MNDVLIASTEDDARAVDAVVQHHAELAGALAVRVARLLDAASAPKTTTIDGVRREITDWCEAELLPHARAEESAMYPAAHSTPDARLLVDAMLAEHREIAALVAEVRSAGDAVKAAAAARALQVVFESHVRKENEQILPLLAAAPGVSVAALLEGMHEQLLGAHPADQATGAQAGHACGCAEHDKPGFPELDARGIPHAIRHATIFGALDGVEPGAGLVLVAPHDPLPLLAQVERRWPGRFAVGYVERGPETWRLSFVRSLARG